VGDVVSFELLLDEQSELDVRAEWEALAGAGLSSLAAHPSASNRPHITLLVRGEVATPDPSALAETFRLPLPIVLGAPLLFGSGERRVLARSVLASAELLRAHAGLHRLAGFGAGEDAPHTRPGDWTPHVTLARRLRLEDVPQALRLLDDVRASSQRSDDRGAERVDARVTSSAVELRRWDSASATVTPLLDHGRGALRSSRS
jgi:2'-5' RNA ligase